MDGKLRLLIDVGRQSFPGPQTRYDEAPKGSYGYSSIVPSEWEALSGRQTWSAERTLKVWRVLTRSRFQPAIAALSSFAWKSRETGFRLPFWATFLWISVTVLQMETVVSETPIAGVPAKLTQSAVRLPLAPTG